MKKRKILLASLTTLFLFWGFNNQTITAQCGDLYIAGALDGALPGGGPNALQLCATANIADLSVYGIESVTNGGGSGGSQEFSLAPDPLNAGDCIWLTSNFAVFNSFFGFDACYQESQINSNGDDTYLLYCGGAVVDALGDPNVDGTGQCWEYMDGWIMNTNGTQNGGVFTCAGYNVSLPGALSGELTNAGATIPYPNPSSNCPFQACGISNVTVMTGGFCSGDDAMFIICADVIGASGDYNLVDVNSGNANLASVTGAATIGNVCITATIPGPTTSSAIDINFVDANDPTCIATTPVGLNIPECPITITCPNAFIGEFAYDCDTGDMNEGIEVCIPNTFTGSLADFTVELYNGGNNSVYSILSLAIDFVQGTNDGINTYYVYSGSGSSIQNGNPDGLALVFQGVSCQFWSYEGTLTAADGAAVGMTSTDVGVSQTNGTPCDMSLMFCNGVWQAGVSTFGTGCDQTVDPPCEAEITSFPANGN